MCTYYAWRLIKTFFTSSSAGWVIIRRITTLVLCKYFSKVLPLIKILVLSSQCTCTLSNQINHSHWHVFSSRSNTIDLRKTWRFVMHNFFMKIFILHAPNLPVVFIKFRIKNLSYYLRLTQSSLKIENQNSQIRLLFFQSMQFGMYLICNMIIC